MPISAEKLASLFQMAYHAAPAHTLQFSGATNKR